MIDDVGSSPAICSFLFTFSNALTCEWSILKSKPLGRKTLNLNVHFNMLALDGVYAEDDDVFLRFHTVGSPSDKEVLRVAGHISRRVEKLMARKDFTPSEWETKQNDQPFLTELYRFTSENGGGFAKIFGARQGSRFRA